MAYGNADGWVRTREETAGITTGRWLLRNAPRIGLAVWIGVVLAAKAAGAIG